MRPNFEAAGLMPVITTDAATRAVLMLGHMNAEALARTIETGEMHYWSRSRAKLWRKGETSGLVQRVIGLLVDDDQDALLAGVEVADDSASCHVGYRSCFYRRIAALGEDSPRPPTLALTEAEKAFDAQAVYGGLPNPTVL